MGLGLGHLMGGNTQGSHADLVTEAQRRRTSSNFIENMLSCPARFDEVLQSAVKEDFELDESEYPHGTSTEKVLSARRNNFLNSGQVLDQIEENTPFGGEGAAPR